MTERAAVDRSLDGADAVLVTREQRPGSEVPGLGSEPLLRAKLR